jgi:hypothetical protein
MKKLIISALFSFAILTVNAGNNPAANINTEATDFARRMINEAHLNESEYIKVRAFTIEKLEKVAEIRSMYSNDADMMAKKLAEAENNYNYKLQSALTEKQFASYVDYTTRSKTAATAAAEIE